VVAAALVAAAALVGFLPGVFRRLVELQVAGNLQRVSRTSPLLARPNGVVATTTAAHRSPGRCSQATISARPTWPTLNAVFESGNAVALSAATVHNLGGTDAGGDTVPCGSFSFAGDGGYTFTAAEVADEVTCAVDYRITNSTGVSDLATVTFVVMPAHSLADRLHDVDDVEHVAELDGGGVGPDDER
jgi:hypothetical protein